MISQVPPNPKAAPQEAGTNVANIDRKGQFGRGIQLSPRLKQVAELIAMGNTDKEISRLSGLTPGTVKIYTHLIYGELGISEGNKRVRLARLLWRDEDIRRCEREMAAIDALPLDGPTGPTEIGPTRGWIDNWLERELLEGKS